VRTVGEYVPGQAVAVQDVAGGWVELQQGLREAHQPVCSGAEREHLYGGVGLLGRPVQNMLELSRHDLRPADVRAQACFAEDAPTARRWRVGPCHRPPTRGTRRDPDFDIAVWKLAAPFEEHAGVILHLQEAGKQLTREEGD